MVTLNPARFAHLLLGKQKLPYVVNTTQGFIKKTNEDRVSVVVNVGRREGWVGEWPQISYFSVFDGHGGSWVSDFLKNRLHEFILRSPSFPLDVPAAITEGCAQAEAAILALCDKDPRLQGAGSCALIIFLVDQQLYVGNIGDSRLVASRHGGKEALALTQDHKPNYPGEKARILSHGGEVRRSLGDPQKPLSEENSPFRLYPGGLSVSRAFGDFTAKTERCGGKRGVLVADPEVFHFDLSRERFDFIFLGCDGIFDVFNTRELVDKIYEYSRHFAPLRSKHRESFFQSVLNSLLHCTMVSGGYDNLTAIWIALAPPE